MADWYYYNENNEKIGPIRGRELIKLAQEGIIMPETTVEDSEGRITAAQNVKNLMFVDTANGTSNTSENSDEQDSELLRQDNERQQEDAQMRTPSIAVPVPPAGANPFSNAPPDGNSPFAQTEETNTSSAQVFCTNCGNPVTEQAVACLSCGAKPTGHKKFCRHCRTPLNPEQVMCTQCGAGVGSPTIAVSPQLLKQLLIPACIASVVLAFIVVVFFVLSSYMDEDKATARKDLREIYDILIKSPDLFIFPVIGYYEEAEAYELEKEILALFNMRRAVNFEAWKRAAEKECPEGEVLLGICLCNDMRFADSNSEAQRDIKEAEMANWFRKAAERGNAIGQFLFAACNHFNGKGIGVPVNKTEMEKWFRKSAEGGFLGAQKVLALLYAVGTVVQQNDAEALKWLRIVAANDDQYFAQFALGMIYFKGKNEIIEKDEAEAVKWFRKSAENDYLPALAQLGKCYYEGIGVSANKKEAVKWLTKAADKNNSESQLLLGKCYFEGSGGLQADKTKAAGYFLKAAENGDREAAYHLAVCYHDGVGLTKDLEKALHWAKRSRILYGASEPTALEEKIERELAEQKGEEYVQPSRPSPSAPSSPSRLRRRPMQ